MQSCGLDVLRVVTGLAVLLGLASGALAQLTTTPGPGGVPIAPGAPPFGHTPGGRSFGGSEVAPGPAARSLPMYREDPAGNPVLIMPERGPGLRSGAGAPGAALGGAASGGAGGTACQAGACLPDGLRFTIAASEAVRAPDAAIDSVQELQIALRACWPPPDGARGEMSVRFAFRRSGELMGPPRVTYATPGAKPDDRKAWRHNIATALESCAPFAFSPRFAAAVAGKPLSVRFVDDRKPQ